MTGATTLRIGSGAGYSGDRIEPAIELAEQGALDFLCFECLAERTIALAQAARAKDPDAGYDPLLERRFRAVLPAARANGVRIVSNMGAANPRGAAAAVVRIARELGLRGLKVAAVVGDDVLDAIRTGDHALLDAAGSSADLADRIISANAYTDAGGIVRALDAGADVVLTGRVGDPALFLGPMIHHFGWAADDWTRLGRGTIIGHLLECAGQLTGGYFADPGVKDVPGLARLGFPFADIAADGSAVFSKVEGSGGLLDLRTCKEQLLYEILDPAAYVQADVVADLTSVRFEQRGPNRVAMTGGGGWPRPDALKVSIGYRDGFIGEGQISYAGPGAVARGELALAIVQERIALTGLAVRDVQATMVGLNAVTQTATQPEPGEVRARFVARTDDAETAARVGAEVEALYTNGPSGGGGAVARVREVVAVASTLLDRSRVATQILIEEA